MTTNDTLASQDDTVNISGVNSKPVKPKKRWRTVLKVIIIIILVKILINITLANYFSPDNKVKRYLHAKYGSNRELSLDGGCWTKRWHMPPRGSNRELSLDGGCWVDLGDCMPRRNAPEWWQIDVILPELHRLPWEWSDDEYCSWRASFKDDPKHIVNVWLDDNYGNRSLRSIKMERGGLK